MHRPCEKFHIKSPYFSHNSQESDCVKRGAAGQTWATSAARGHQLCPCLSWHTFLTAGGFRGGSADSSSWMKRLQAGLLGMPPVTGGMGLLCCWSTGHSWYREVNEHRDRAVDGTGGLLHPPGPGNAAAGGLHGSSLWGAGAAWCSVAPWLFVPLLPALPAHARCATGKPWGRERFLYNIAGGVLREETASVGGHFSVTKSKETYLIHSCPKPFVYKTLLLIQIKVALTGQPLWPDIP